MGSKTKSRDVLKEQARGFLNRAEKLGEITEERRKDILGVLCDASVDISNKDVLKEKLSGSLSDEEFEGVYGDYLEYNRHAIVDLKKYFEDIKLFPEGYEFLSKYMAILCVRFGDDVDDLKNSLTPDAIGGYRESFYKNIMILKNSLGVRDNDLGKFMDFIINSEIDEEKVLENIKLFKEFGLDTREDLIKLQDLFDCEYTENMKLFLNVGINTADDLLKLKNKGVIYHDSKYIKLFVDLGINTVDDFLKLDDNSLMCPDVKTLELFNDLGINNIDDLISLKEFLNYSSYYCADNIKLFIDVGMKTVDDFLKLKKLIISQRLSETQSGNVLLLFNAGINTADDFVKLSDIIFRGNDGNLGLICNSLKNNGEKKLVADDILKLEDFVSYGTGYYYNNIKLFVDMGINTVDDFLKLEDIIIAGGVLSDNLVYKIKILSGGGINTADDILKLKDIIYRGNEDNLRMICDALTNNGEQKLVADDIIKLTDIIEANRCGDNLGLFISAGICRVDDFLKLKNFIFEGNSDILESFVFAGMKNVDDFLQIADQMKYRYPDNVKHNINTFRELGITDINDLLKLKNCIFTNYHTISKRIKTLKLAKVSSVDDFVKLGKFIVSDEAENFLSKVSEIAQKTGINFDKDLFKLSDFMHEVFESLSYYGYGTELQNNILFLYYEAGYSLDDMRNNLAILQSNTEVLQLIYQRYCKDGISLNQLSGLQDVLYYAKESNLNLLFKYYPDISIEELVGLSDVLGSTNLNFNNFKLLFQYFNPNIDDIKTYKNLFLFGGNIPSNLEFKEDNRKGYLKYLQKFFDVLNGYYIFTYDEIESIISYVVKLDFPDVENYFIQLKKFCIDQDHSYKDFVKCFDGKSINFEMFKFMSRGFEVSEPENKNDVDILNNSINMLYPKLNIKFNENECKKILDFVDSIGGINKGYTILVLTMEKMVRDGVDVKNLSHLLCEKLDNYKKVFDMYPEDKIPKGLKISVGLEIEMTRLYSDWYKENMGEDYRQVVDKIVGNAKIGMENEGAYEFATKPSTNPMVALLEIHLLQELNLLDLNDMQKLSCDSGSISYKGRNGTGYHLNIGSDSDIGIDGNVQFIQNLCTMLPWGGICNGEKIKEVNHYSNLNSKASKFSIFPNSESKKYVELRTYSIDDVELFEKNVLFNTYAIMGSQAEKLALYLSGKDVNLLSYDENIHSVADLVAYFNENNLVKNVDDIKTQMIAAEFVFMQIEVLRAIRDYNDNFIDNELFGNDLVGNLSEPWKNYFFDLLLSDNKETIGFGDEGRSSMVVNRYTNLKNTFDVKKYLQKNEPFSDLETKDILSEFGNSVDEKWIPYVTIWLNKQLLWQLFSDGCSDTQELQDKINNKMFNIDRIKSYIRGTDKNLKIDRQYLYDYFKSTMSLGNFNPYHLLNDEFMNTVINLNNFFLKKDDTNANGVLKKTIFEGGEESDISKSSIFETGYIRKGYNYYQGGTDNMLLHNVQKIALNYMDNVKNILNLDPVESGTDYKLAA